MAKTNVSATKTAGSSSPDKPSKPKRPLGRFPAHSPGFLGFVLGQREAEHRAKAKAKADAQDETKTASPSKEGKDAKDNKAEAKASLSNNRHRRDARRHAVPPKKAGDNKPSPPPPIKLTLRDLDGRCRTLTVQIRPDLAVDRLLHTIRHHHHGSTAAKSVSTSSSSSDRPVVLLYTRDGPRGHSSKADPRQLEPGSVVRDSCKSGSTLYYRVVPAAEAEGRVPSLDIAVEWPSSALSSSARHHRKAEPKRPTLAPDVVRTLARDIADPAAHVSVEDVRTRLARALAVDDPRRIALVTRGGLHPGQALAGAAWQVGRLLDDWLCRDLVAEVHPPRRFVTLRGGGGTERGGDPPGGLRTYLCHPWRPDEPSSASASDARTVLRPDRPVVVRALQAWILAQLLQGVHKQVASQVDTRARRIQVVQIEERVLDRREEVPWGTTFAFRLPDDLVEAFADDETWLLRPTETCMICCEDKAATELPHAVAAGCQTQADAGRRHVPSLCKPCLAEWIRASLQDHAWDRLTCPECPARLAHADVRLHAAADVFARYDDLATRAAIEQAFPDFRWCLAPGCGAGQIDHRRTAGTSAEACPKFRCYACRAAQCVRHNMPWHAGETCEQYDRRTRQRRRDDRKSEQLVQQTAKECPSCRKPVHKSGGCNHMTCHCGHQWCYICFAPFVVGPYGILHCTHRPACPERDLFDELGLRDAPQQQPQPPFRVRNAPGMPGMPGMPVPVPHLRPVWTGGVRRPGVPPWMDPHWPRGPVDPAQLG